MPKHRSFFEERRASNGVFYQLVGKGEPVLLLHGLLFNGAMFDPLADLLQDRFCMVIPDLRGHGRSKDLSGPYDVASLAADLDAVLESAGYERCAVLGYSYGGAIAQQFAYMRRERVTRLMLACAYSCVSTTVKERIEARILLTLLALFAPSTLAKLIVRPLKGRQGEAIGLDETQSAWLRTLMGDNHADKMREVVRDLTKFDSRSWLPEISIPTLVVGGGRDATVPQRHFDALIEGIPEAQGYLIETAGHALLWTHTSEFADIIQTRWR